MKVFLQTLLCIPVLLTISAQGKDKGKTQWSPLIVASGTHPSKNVAKKIYSLNEDENESDNMINTNLNSNNKLLNNIHSLEKSSKVDIEESKSGENSDKVVSSSVRKERGIGSFHDGFVPGYGIGISGGIGPYASHNSANYGGANRQTGQKGFKNVNQYSGVKDEGVYGKGAAGYAGEHNKQNGYAKGYTKGYEHKYNHQFNHDYGRAHNHNRHLRHNHGVNHRLHNIGQGGYRNGLYNDNNYGQYNNVRRIIPFGIPGYGLHYGTGIARPFLGGYGYGGLGHPLHSYNRLRSIGTVGYGYGIPHWHGIPHNTGWQGIGYQPIGNTYQHRIPWQFNYG